MIERLRNLKKALKGDTYDKTLKLFPTNIKD